jgi:hypothetical protein
LLSAGDGDGGPAVFSVPVSWAYRCSLYAMKRAVSSPKRILYSLNSAGFLVRWMLVARVMRCLRRRLGAYSPLLLLISLDSGVESSSLLGAAANSGCQQMHLRWICCWVSQEGCRMVGRYCRAWFGWCFVLLFASIDGFVDLQWTVLVRFT